MYKITLFFPKISNEQFRFYFNPIHSWQWQSDSHLAKGVQVQSFCIAVCFSFLKRRGDELRGHCSVSYVTGSHFRLLSVISHHFYIDMVIDSNGLFHLWQCSCFWKYLISRGLLSKDNLNCYFITVCKKSPRILESIKKMSFSYNFYHMKNHC